jgi:hypothetical protein
MAANFFAFPLGLLAPADLDWKDTIQRMVSYCVVDQGRKLIESLDEDEIDERISKAKLRSDYSTRGKNANDVKAAVLGAELLNVSVGSIAGTLQRHKEGTQIVSEHEYAYGASPLVFIAAKLLWETHSERGLSWREFQILCAVNSVIGLTRTHPVLIRREMIHARSVGFKRPADWKSAIGARPTLTLSQLRTTLDHLEERELFVRVVASPRNTYFAKDITREEARALVKEILDRRKSKLSEERAKDRKLMGGK